MVSVLPTSLPDRGELLGGENAYMDKSLDGCKFYTRLAFEMPNPRVAAKL